MINRNVQPELLDASPPDDPGAVRSRRDLRRVNAWMHNHTIMARALKNNFGSLVPERITELGAGDGHFLLRVAQKLSPSWPDVNVTLLDRQKNVSDGTLASFSSLGWRAEIVVADVFDWPPAPTQFVIANLFLHHFEDEQLTELLRVISQRAKLFVAIEPQRFRYAFPCGQLLWLIGCNYVTRHDATVSIRAGFLGYELSTLWPDKKNWRLTERRAGLFSHLFIAQKIS
jgi:Methyltransferase domain